MLVPNGEVPVVLEKDILKLDQNEYFFEMEIKSYNESRDYSPTDLHDVR